MRGLKAFLSGFYAVVSMFANSYIDRKTRNSVETVTCLLVYSHAKRALMMVVRIHL